ncbi:peroxisome proliferator-activated receptor gamma coactivator-related protein 1-like [Lytechinus variegatus]|uniref:peroxisome proliferator-activated receptor gamma coactivator-related protein 1-like n=1 Tax=Lytechinus variegatus TaxID=7654 RepID=UPI001BB2D04F|nr:peroxisome proliferator-activated receptor gamma coactivator-related protein 1-like [Lytechinus variegatus]XP_041476527.1 peroxisome proliferator-activated receptor gamma coactivator-related protein 1-like [Lytechinus variegatus]
MAQVNNSFEFGDPPDAGLEWHQLMQNEGYDLSKFELVAVPEEFSDASGTDLLGHGGLLEYDGVLDVEGSDSDESCVDPGEGFNVTIEHVGDDFSQGSGLVHLLEVPQNLSSDTKQYHKDDILDVGIEACDLKSLLEQFEESEQPRVKPVPQPASSPAPKPSMRDPRIVTKMKELPSPAEVIKKIAPVKRKGAILLDPTTLPAKKVKPKQVSQNHEVSKAIQLARSTHAASPIPFNLKHLIPAPKYLSMEHDYCMSPAASEKSTGSDLPNQMTKEERRAYYKYKYRIKKKVNGVDSPSKSSSVSSSPRSLSPASMSPNPGVVEVGDGKVPKANPAAVVPLFDKIPGYFSKKLLVGMYREINSEGPSKQVHQGYDQNIFVSSENDGGKIPDSSKERKSRLHIRRRHCRSYRDSRRKNSLSSQSDSSCCSSCSERSHNPGESDLEHDKRSRNPNQRVQRRRRTRDSVCSARSRNSRSPSYSRSRSPAYSSHSDFDSHRHSRSFSRSRSRSFSRSRSRSFSRSRSRSYSRSPFYSRSRSRSRSYSRSRSRPRSRSRSPRDYSRRSRSYSRSLSRSPIRTSRSSSRRFSRSPHSRSRGRSSSRRSLSRSRSRPRSRHRDNNNRSHSQIRTHDPHGNSNEVIYSAQQLQEFEERRVVYVGNISDDTSRLDLMKQFSRFGPVDKIQLYFRNDMDNYGFVTFHYKCDAVAAITAGHDPNWPKYDLCFGGRRKFCTKKYEDLDSLNNASADLDYGYHGNREKEEDDASAKDEGPEESEFDKLLKAAMKNKNKRR